jgi:hypothetical protein
MGFLSVGCNIQANLEKSTEKSVEVRLYKKGVDFSVQSLRVLPVKNQYADDYKEVKGLSYNGTVFSFKGASLGFFSIDNMEIVLCSDQFKNDGTISGGCEDVPEGELSIYVPYFPNGKYVDIYNPEGKKVLTIDLSSKATCNENNNCDSPLEDSINCPSDCKDNQPIIESSLKQQTSVQNENSLSQNEQGWLESWGKLALAALILAVVGIGVMIARQRRH